jgi:DNA repair exonuclease SbcCD ATPase subunit
MITLKNLTAKNFMSIGNQVQSVNFETDNLTLIIGENLDQGGDSSGVKNGVGKSCIVNALSFALFGNAISNIKKDNLVNKVNGKNMLVSLSFSKDDVEYRIERGRKPAIFKFYVNDKLQDETTDDAQGEIKDTQKDIISLLGMSHEMFKHIIVLNTYTEPFLSSRVADQRVIIEQLLGITLLSEKAEALKENIKQNKDLIFIENTELEATKKSNEKIQQSIDTLTTRQKVWNNQKNADLEKIASSIDKLKKVDIDNELQLHTDLKKYLEQVADHSRLSKELMTLESAVVQAQKTLLKYEQELDSLTHKKCHACEQELHDHKHSEMLAVAKHNLDDSQSYFNQVSADYVKVADKLTRITLGNRPDTFYDTVEKALAHQNNLQSLETQLVNRANETDPYQEQIDELNNTAIQELKWDKINEYTELKEHQEFLLKLLTNKDSFIRKQIIEQNLSFLNTRLGYYLEKIGLPHTVIFKNDLSVEITQLGHELDFHNLSRGEMNRLCLSLSWAFRDVFEHLYQSINLLFVDEMVDFGMDASGVENSLSILKSFSRDRHKNVFLISHKEELVNRVDNVLKVIKENNFTTFSTEVEIIGC